MRVAEAVGRAAADAGVAAAFGLIGSGNLAIANALRAAGVPFYAARHEGGAVCMADGYARVSGAVAACTVHQGPGLTNAITGLTEAAKSRTPLVVLAADTPAAARESNFRIDQDALVESVGAVAERVHGPETATADVARAVRLARQERRAVVLMVALDVQAMDVPEPASAATTAPAPMPPHPSPAAVAQVAALLAEARRPAILAGRGAVRSGAGPALRALGERIGAVLATSAPANGLFAGDPLAVGIAGGFSSPVARRLLGASDLVLAFGAALNPWTTRHGTLFADGARVVQVDVDAAALGRHGPIVAGVLGDASATAEALLGAVEPGAGHRKDGAASAVAAGRWRDEAYAEGGDRLDPRSLSIALDDLLPEERTVVVDSGHFMGWPSMYLRVPDPQGFVFPQAFQCVGLALGNALGAAFARPDRLTVACLGDGGALLALPELETLGRLGLPLLVVIYDDAAYGAEVHHFRPLGEDLDLVRFPDTDFAALAEAAGCRGLAVRRVDELEGVERWLRERDRPLVVDAKIDPDVCADWLSDAFRH